MRRGLETEHPAKVTAVKRPAGETRGKVAAGPNAGQRHRASPRPYILIFEWPSYGLIRHGVSPWGIAKPLVDEAIDQDPHRPPRGFGCFSTLPRCRCLARPHLHRR